MTSRTQKLRAACMAAAAALAIAAAPLAAKEAAPTAFDPVAHSRVVEVSKQLRCLVCQNESIADSQAELAIDLRNQVIAQVRAGKTNEEIVQYMVDGDGDFVLYSPPLKTSPLSRWLGPAALFLGGIAAFVINVRRRKRLVAEASKPLTAEEQALADELLSEKKE